MTTSEDQARNGTDHEPESLTLLRRNAFNLANLGGSKNFMMKKLLNEQGRLCVLTSLLASFGYKLCESLHPSRRTG